MKELLKVTTSLILFIAIALAGLTFARNFNRQPSVLLTSTQCNPPCWYGIQPGKSSTAQVYSLLDQIAGIDKNTILGEINHYDQLIRIFWFFQRPVEDSMGSVNIDHDRAIAINISTVNSLKLSELFNKLGEPEQYWTGIGQRDGGEEFLDIVFLSPSVGYVEPRCSGGAISRMPDISSTPWHEEPTAILPNLAPRRQSPSIFIDRPSLAAPAS